jgi:hypothetical protein
LIETSEIFSYCAKRGAMCCNFDFFQKNQKELSQKIFITILKAKKVKSIFFQKNEK